MWTVNGSRGVWSSTHAPTDGPRVDNERLAEPGDFSTKGSFRGYGRRRYRYADTQLLITGVVLVNELNAVPEDIVAEDVATGGFVARFCAAVAAGDVDAVIETMAEDAEMVTPLSSRAVIRGRDDLRVVFASLLPTLSRDLHWRLRVGNADATVAVAEARLGGVRVQDAMLIEQDRDGRIRRVTPHVRPWLGLTVSGFVLGLKLVRHVGVMRRAMRRK